MRTLNEQSHYEVLEVARDATLEEIERAYRIAREAYGSGSLALYSVFGDSDATVIRDRVEEAYHVLSDAERRRAYETSRTLEAGDSVECDQEASPSEFDSGGPSTRQVEELSLLGKAFIDFAADVEEEAGDFDGAKLRRARMRRGIELDEIAEVTKVSTTNLRHLEEENFDDLPATVYVRGFVTAYSKTIGLDPRKVVTGYLARVERVRADQGRPRFLGRR